MNFSSLAKKAGHLAVEHSPQILTTIGVVGAITTAYLAGKAAWQAADAVREVEAEVYRSEEDRRDPRDMLKDRINLTWRLFIPTAGMAVVTCACIIGSAKVSARRTAGFAALYTLSEKSLDEYKAKVSEKFGERKEEAVRDEIMQDRMNHIDAEDPRLLAITDNEACYDKFSDRFFQGSVEGIRSVVNDFNRMLLHDDIGSLADFYRMLDMSDTPTYAEHIGWNSSHLVEVVFSSVLVSGVKPVIAMDFKEAPTEDYGRFHR